MMNVMRMLLGAEHMLQIVSSHNWNTTDWLLLLFAGYVICVTADPHTS